MKKPITLISSFLLTGFVSVSALTLDDFNVVTKQTFVTDYIFRGVKEAGESVQTEAEVSVMDAYLGAWGNFPVKQAKGDNELNFYAGYEFVIPNLENVVLDGGLTVYYYPDGADTANNRTHEWYIGAEITEFGIQGVSAGTYLRHDTDLKTTTVQPYVAYSFNLEEVGIPNTAIEMEAYIGFIDGRKGSESYNYYGFSFAVPYTINEIAGVSFGVGYEDNDGTPEKGNHIFGSASISLGF